MMIKKHELESLAEEIETIDHQIGQINPDEVDLDGEWLGALDDLRVKAWNLHVKCETLMEEMSEEEED